MLSTLFKNKGTAIIAVPFVSLFKINCYKNVEINII